MYVRQNCRYSSLTAPLRQLRWGSEKQEAFEKFKGSIRSECIMAHFDVSRPIIVRAEASHVFRRIILGNRQRSQTRPLHKSYPDLKIENQVREIIISEIQIPGCYQALASTPHLSEETFLKLYVVHSDPFDLIRETGLSFCSPHALT